MNPATAHNAQPIVLRVNQPHLLAHLVSPQWPHSQVSLANVYYLLISTPLRVLVSPVTLHALHVHLEMQIIVFLAVPMLRSRLLTHATVTQHTTLLRLINALHAVPYVWIALVQAPINALVVAQAQPQL